MSATLGLSLAVAAVVWAVDDGEKIKEDEPPAALAAGEGNPVWAPNAPIRLVALKNETVSFQVVVAATTAPLTRVTVDLDALKSDGGTIANAPGATDPTRFVGRPIERFVEHFLDVSRASGGTYKPPFEDECLGWAPGSGPTKGRFLGRMPDALIPVEVAPSWRPYPLELAAKQNGIVWVDVTIGANQSAGLYRGDVVVKANGEPLATLPLEIDVANATLPDVPVRTMLAYHPSEIERRMGAPASEAALKHFFQLLHRHRIAPMHRASTVEEVKKQLPSLDGSLYTTGYEGPGVGRGAGVLALGAYGELGDPTPEKAQLVAAMAATLAEAKVLEHTDTFVYAEDESCESPRGKQWRDLLTSSKVDKAVRVGWTCNDIDPAKQAVDVVIQEAVLDRDKTAKARALGKEVWTYNGRLPWTGTMVMDAPATSMRVDGWLSAIYDIDRWFVWEAMAWFDENAGGHGPFDPYVTAETFHNKTDDHTNGDGVFVYPGRQEPPFAAHSLGFDGVVATIRLKNWRRGIQDAGYYQLASAANAKASEAIAKKLIPAAFETATRGKPAAWSESGKPFFEARRQLRALIPPGTDGGAGRGASLASRDPSPRARCGCGGCSQSGPAVFLGVAWFIARRARSKRQRERVA